MEIKLEVNEVEEDIRFWIALALQRNENIGYNILDPTFRYSDIATAHYISRYFKGTMLVTRAFNEVDGRDNTAIDNDIERLKKQMVMLAKIHRMAVEKEND